MGSLTRTAHAGFGLLLAAAAIVGVFGHSVPHARSSGPTVQLDQGTFLGNATANVTQFLGIPYAIPPVDTLRLTIPRANLPYNGTFNATAFGPSCPQQTSSIPATSLAVLAPFLGELSGLTGGSSTNVQSEDCLNLDVILPNDTPSEAKLPVVVWIYGGGFEDGELLNDDGGVIVQRSIDLGTPVIYVAMNYRLSAFGFLPGQEVKEAGVGNLGLQDQRLALRWVQKYIGAFGGDPDRVIIWGESAGAISVASQMITNGGDTEGLFHGAIMESGSPTPSGDIADEESQAVYDSIVDATGCTGAEDTLQCLRELPFSVLNDASNNTFGIDSFSSLNLAFQPRVDGIFFTEDPQQLVLDGQVADVPFITGDCSDEGTLFSLSSVNLTTDAEAEAYIQSTYFSTLSLDDLASVFQAYPSDPTVGSPFDTGSANVITPQFKRIAAIQGDLVFQAPRRFFLQQRSDKQKTWAFLSDRLKSTPLLGSFHSSDLLNAYGPGDLTDVIVNFANNLDPNGPTIIEWPNYSTDAPTLLTLLDGAVPQTLTNDTFRVDGMAALTNISLIAPI
ncbi:carotenoid ester lipase precursor [Stereum hirsutum FP-91666 SS1]|uniref:carotenoid ester lipase precursor n=1 Tax=Stereum hirsutum (strain FP-91666) TaxID=721885 RepID=UPI00044498C0|nr:carotenoid ester lipase precursor [Stereum hirsutum FP-91666 SS1]EIM86204.1 carotenoid ester lipase precursor [Stereum hirsutum FP-91666 SS1]